MSAVSSKVLTVVCCLILFCKTNAQNFSYSVNSPEYQNNYGQQEVKTADETRGSYYVLLPDGRLQTVTYRVDSVSGFVANITYTYPSRQTTAQATTNKPQSTVTNRRPSIVQTLLTTVRPPARRTEKPAGTGKPVGTVKPAGSGKPVGTGKPAGTGKPIETGKPAGTGKPIETGKPVGTNPSVDDLASPNGPPDYLDISYDYDGGLFNGEDSVVIPDTENNFFFPLPRPPMNILFPDETGGNSQKDKVPDNNFNGLVFPGEENPIPPSVLSPESNDLELLLTLFKEDDVGDTNPNSNVGNENSLGYDPDFPLPPEFS